MKKRSPLPFLLLSLVSCGFQKSIGYLYSAELRNVFINADSNGNTYSTLMKAGKAEEISFRLRNEENLILFITSTACSHCTDLEPSMISFLEQTHLEVFYLEDRELFTQIVALEREFPHLKPIREQYGTPYMFVVDANNLIPVSVSGKDPYQIADALFEFINYMPVKRMESLDTYASYDGKDILRYFTSKEDDSYIDFCHYRNLFATDKEVLVLDSSFWSEETFTKYEAKYGVFLSGYVNFEGNSYPFVSENAKEILDSYLS